MAPSTHSGQSLSSTRQAALQRAQDCFRTASLHPSTQEFRQKCMEDQAFYDGTGQWTARDLQTLLMREQLPITVNICKGYVDALSGVEIQSRYRTACRSDSHKPQDDKLTEALTHWLYYIQEHQDLPYKGSLKFRDSLICGIGWSHLCKENGVYYYDYVHPFNVIPDPDDLSPQYTTMKYVCRKRWMSPDMLKARWPKAREVDIAPDDFNYYGGVFSSDLVKVGINGKSVLLREYFYYLLKNDTYIKEIQKFSAGSIVKSVALENMASIKIPLPPLSIQAEMVKEFNQYERLMVAQNETAQFVEEKCQEQLNRL